MGTKEISKAGERAKAVAEILDAFPDIMRRLIESEPITGHELVLTLAQVRALGVLEERDGCTMGELARRLGVSLSATTGLADRLVQHGGIERVADPADRRVVRLRLSREGRRARDSFRREKRRRMETVLHGLSLAELNRVADSLALLREALDGERTL
jgi:DNA-binding MarR family transcriptional regulator